MKFKSRLFDLLFLFLKTMESNQTSSTFSNSFSMFVIFAHFAQMLSYLLKITENYILTDQFLYFEKLTVYVNFSNILLFLDGFSVFLIVYFAVLSLIAFLIAYIFLLYALQKFFRTKMSKIMLFLNFIYSSLFELFFAILTLPMVDILMFPLYCDKQDNSNMFCDAKATYLQYTSIPSILLIFCLGMFYIVMIRNYAFLDLTNVRMNFSTKQIICFCLKFSLALFYPIITKDNEYIYHLMLHGIALLSFFDYIYYFPIRNQKLNKFYISILFSFEGILIVLTCWRYFTILQDDSLLVVVLVFVLFMIKKGVGISYARSFSIYINTFKETKKIAYILEEIVISFDSHKASTISNYMLCGLLKNHSKYCVYKKCKFTSKHMKKFETFGIEEQESCINRFIFQRFTNVIAQVKKEAYCEDLLLKFMSYLVHSRFTPQKAFLEAQKLPTIIKNISFHGQLVFDLLNRKLEIKIEEIDKERQLTENLFDQNGNMQIKEFFAFTMQKENLENGMKNLLKSKISLWEKFLNGFQSYEEAIKKLNIFSKKALSYKKKLESSLKTTKDNVILYKFCSIYNCAIVSRIIDAVKYEDEIENVRKRYIRAELNQLSPMIFFQNNYITCEASFLSSKGEILESSKNAKFAKFFNYTMEETKNITNLETLMPQMISENHHKFVKWSLNRPTKELIAKKPEFMSFALDKDELVFPVKIFLSHRFNYANDFVMHAALLKLDWKGVPFLLFDPLGNILGLNKELLVKFKEDVNKITANKILFLNAFNIISNLKEYVQNNKIFEDESILEYRNLNGSLHIFENLTTIIDLIKFRRDQIKFINQSKKDDLSSRNLSSKTVRTINTKASKTTSVNKNDINNKISQYINKWQLEAKNNDFSNKLLLNKVFLDDSWTDELIVNLLTEKVSSNNRRIIYDISIYQTRFGKSNNDFVKFAALSIKHMSENWMTQEEQRENTIKKCLSVSMDSKVLDSSYHSLKLPGENTFDFKVEFDRLNMSRSDMSVTPSIPQKSENGLSNVQEPFAANLKTKEIEKQPKITQNVVETEQMLLNKNENEDNEKKSTEMKKQMSLKYYSEAKKEKLSLNSSTKSREEIRLKNLKGKTTDLGPLEINNMENSLNTSSRATSKGSYTIINMMEVIQFKYPRSIRNISILFLFQIILIFCYSIALYVLSDSYINNYYLPLQEAAIEQSKVNSDFAFFACIFNEQEYVFRFPDIEIMSDFQLYAFEKLLKLIEQEAMDLLHKERTKPFKFQYQPYLRDLKVTFVSYQDYTPKTIYFNDLTDFFLLMVQMHLNQDPKIITPLDVQNVLQRNMVYYLPTAANIRAKIQDEFLSSNQIVGSQILIIFALMISIIVIVKTVEYSIYFKYMDNLTKLVNIFLRINQREASNEFFMAKQILDLLNDPLKSYLNEYFPDKCAQKTHFNDILEGIEGNGVKHTKKKKDKTEKVKISSNKKFSLYNLQTLSKHRVLVFLMISAGLIMGYLVCNYVFWTNTNNTISQLISVNIMFNNLYIFSTTTMTYNNLMIREAGERDPLYEASGDPMQNHQDRMNYFYNLKQARLNHLQSFVEDLPNFALPAQSVINDVNYDELLHGSACLALFQKNMLDEEMFTFCQTDFKGAFTKGILNFMNQYIQVILDQNSITFLPNNVSEIEKQMAQLQIYYHDITTGTLPISVYVITRGLILFYNYISDYYGNVLYTQLANMNLLLWITCVISFLIISVFGILMLKYMRTIYFRTAFILGLIPNEKLINDEQTIYLIKQFWKENN